MEYIDLKNQNDDFIGRLIVSCPFPTRHMWNEFQEAASAVNMLPVYKQNFLCLLQVIHDLHKRKRSSTGSSTLHFFHTFNEFAEEFDWFDVEYQMARGRYSRIIRHCRS